MLATINLQPVEFTEGETILEVARRTGTFIPTLCELRRSITVRALAACASSRSPAPTARAAW